MTVFFTAAPYGWRSDLAPITDYVPQIAPRAAAARGRALGRLLIQGGDTAGACAMRPRWRIFPQERKVAPGRAEEGGAPPAERRCCYCRSGAGAARATVGSEVSGHGTGAGGASSRRLALRRAGIAWAGGAAALGPVLPGGRKPGGGEGLAGCPGSWGGGERGMVRRPRALQSDSRNMAVAALARLGRWSRGSPEWQNGRCCLLSRVCGRRTAALPPAR